MIVGLFLCIFFAFLRKRCYEIFLISHVLGAIMMLVGIIYRELLPFASLF